MILPPAPKAGQCMLLIYTPHITNRLKYVFDHIFRQQFGIDYAVTSNGEEFAVTNNIAKLEYGKSRNTGAPYFFATSLLFQTAIEELTPGEGFSDKIPVIFPHDKEAILNFDVFAAVFYLLSRYEEYLPHIPDTYGNFDYRQSVLYRLNCLHRPLADEWIRLLKDKLKAIFPNLSFIEKKPCYLLSFDIDVAFAYRHRSISRTIGGLVKKAVSFQFKSLSDQISTLFGLKRDMFDTYDYMLEKSSPHPAIFFFNMGHYGRYDKNPSSNNGAFRMLIREITKAHETGLHPSYASNNNQALLSREKNRLEHITGKPVSASRQHYLKLRMPQTFRNLLSNGITKDFTIGYYFYYGFRAGTAQPFFFFDLEADTATNLSLYPFVYMDGTLKDALQMTATDAKKLVSELITRVADVNGIFIPLWHNSTLGETDGWEGWRAVFEYTIDELARRNFFAYPVQNT